MGHLKAWLAALLCCALLLTGACGVLAEEVESEPVDEFVAEVEASTEAMLEGGCPHSRVETWTRFSGDATYTPIDNMYHMTTGKAELVTYCYECETELNVEDAGVVSEREWHYYENGVCQQCGHKNTCKHAKTYEGHYFDGTPTYKSVDDKEHTATGNLHLTRECEDCGQTISDTTKKNGSVKEPHYYVNGVCEQCGHKNACKHKNVDQWPSYDDPKFTPIDSMYHQLSGTKYMITYCRDCESEIASENLGKVTEREEHHFENGVCEQCGYVNTCKHEKTEDFTYYMDMTFKAIKNNNKEHKATGMKYTGKQCVNCGEEFDVKSAGKVTEKWGHNYNSKGVCTSCGYKNKCKHKKKIKREGFYYGDCTYAQKDALTHSATGEYYTWTYCQDCWMSFNVKSQGVKTVTEDHFYYRGPCVCGAESNLATFTVEPKTLTLGVGDKYVLTGIKALKADGNKADTNVYVYSDSKNAPASNKNGVFTITAKKTGKANLYVSSDVNGTTVKIPVTVKKAPSKVSITKKLSLEVGKTAQLKPTLPKNTYTAILTYTTSNADVATVDEKGLITAVSAGTAKITVKTGNGKKATCTVTIK